HSDPICQPGLFRSRLKPLHYPKPAAFSCTPPISHIFIAGMNEPAHGRFRSEIYCHLPVFSHLQRISMWGGGRYTAHHGFRFAKTRIEPHPHPKDGRTPMI